MFSKNDKNVVEETSFSKFIRDARSEEKRKVYSDVIKEASEKQNSIDKKP